MKLSKLLPEMLPRHCQINLTNNGPKGVAGDFEVQTQSSNPCNVDGSGSQYVLEVRNYRPDPLGVKVRCESQNGEVEFQNANGWEKEWEASFVVGKRSGGNPGVNTVTADLRPGTNSDTDENVSTEMDAKEIVLGDSPSLSETIKVSVN